MRRASSAQVANLHVFWSCPKFKTIPILILTTESSDQMKQAGRTAGATGWLVKPFDPNRLIEVIQKVIR